MRQIFTSAIDKRLDDFLANAPVTAHILQGTGCIYTINMNTILFVC